MHLTEAYGHTGFAFITNNNQQKKTKKL